MSAKAAAPPTSGLRRLAERLVWLLAGPPWRLTWSAILVLAFAGASVALWFYVRDQALGKREYLVGPQDIAIPARPAWIRTDITAEVYRNACLDAPLRVVDDDLCERLFEAFAAHPWVAKVERVAKRYPAHVSVDLAYRRPVCMVEVPATVLPGGLVEVPPALLPVDVEGVLLPEADFKPDERLAYPRVSGIATRPLGGPGSRWGDARVTGGAEVAAALVEVWGPLRLARIVPEPKPDRGPDGDEYRYQIFTERGTRILWGRSPNSQMPGEVPAIDKITRLKRYAAEHGSLDRPEAPHEIDLRTWR